MRIIPVTSPDELRELALAAKTDKARHQINAIAAIWSNKLKADPAATIPYEISLEISNGAKLSYRNTRTQIKTIVGAIYIAPARDFANRHHEE